MDALDSEIVKGRDAGPRLGQNEITHISQQCEGALNWKADTPRTSDPAKRKKSEKEEGLQALWQSNMAKGEFTSSEKRIGDPIVNQKKIQQQAKGKRGNQERIARPQMLWGKKKVRILVPCSQLKKTNLIRWARV